MSMDNTYWKASGPHPGVLTPLLPHIMVMAFLMWRSMRSYKPKRVPCYIYTSFLSCFALVASIGIAVALLQSKSSDGVATTTGALALIGCALLHHTHSQFLCVAISIMYTLIQVTLQNNSGFGLITILPGIVLLVGYIISSPWVLRMFGPGGLLLACVVSVIFTVLCCATNVHYSLTTIIATGSFVSIWMSGFNPVRRDRVRSSSTGFIVCALSAIVCITNWIHHPETILGLVSIAMIALVAIAGRFAACTATLQSTLISEKRSFTILAISIITCFATLASIPVSEIIYTNLTHAILMMSIGFSACMCFLAFTTAAVDFWHPVTAPSYRMAAVDFGAVLVLFGVGLFVLATQTYEFPQMYNTLLSLLNNLRVVLKNSTSNASIWDWQNDSLNSLTSCTLILASLYVLRLITGVTPFMTMIFSNVRTFSTPNSRQVALTFETDKNARLNGILNALKRSKSMHATFFINVPSKFEELATLRKQGHEIGLLGDTKMTSEMFEAAVDVLSYRGAASVEHTMWYRPANGSQNVFELQKANAHGLIAVFWSYTLNNTRMHPSGGDIVRIQLQAEDVDDQSDEICNDTTNALNVIDSIREIHLNSVTLSQLCHASAGREVADLHHAKL